MCNYHQQINEREKQSKAARDYRIDFINRITPRLRHDKNCVSYWKKLHPFCTSAISPNEKWEPGGSLIAGTEMVGRDGFEPT